jgi:hypothetical protein
MVRNKARLIIPSSYSSIGLHRRYLGGRIPPTIEIRNPRLGARVNIDIPAEYMEGRKDGNPMFCRENLIELCTTALGSVPDWDFIIQRRIKEGRSLELAWRLDTKLDWVWQNECVDGTPRNWAVLCGLALKQASSQTEFIVDVN